MEILGLEGKTDKDIQEELNRGGKFVIFQYCISIIFMTFKRPSDIYFIKAGQGTLRTSIGYTLISLLFGWWGIPWGLLWTIESVITNLYGGKNVTDEVLAYLNSLPESEPSNILSRKAPLPKSEFIKHPKKQEEQEKLEVNMTNISWSHRHLKLLKVTLVAFSILAIGLGSLALYNYQEYNYLYQEHTNLTNQHYILLHQHEVLEDKHKELNSNYKKLGNEYTELRGEHTSLQQHTRTLEDKVVSVEAEPKRWKPTQGKVWSNPYTYIVSGDYEPIILVDYPTATNPSYTQLLTFIASDTTEKRVYTSSFMCGSFAEVLHNNAEKAGIRAGYVVLDDHAFNVFDTYDRGLIYIDSTGDTHGTGIDWIVYVGYDYTGRWTIVAEPLWDTQYLTVALNAGNLEAIIWEGSNIAPTTTQTYPPNYLPPTVPT